jgi:arylsulfatase A-like enzyme
LLDIFPTLGELAGVKAPDGNEGKSLVPLMTGKEAIARDSIFLAYLKVQRAVRDDRWKLIAYPQINHRQLFDLKNDPHEVKDLASNPEYGREIERLTGLLQRRQRDLGDTQPLTTPMPAPKSFDFSKVSTK